MKATTHTEVYRPFTGSLLTRPMRPLVLAKGAIRLGFKKKLPALLLYMPFFIAAIAVSFRVYFGFSMMEQAAGPEADLEAVFASAQMKALLGDVVENVFIFIQVTSWFGLVVMAWYGSGLINEDKRLGANLLYFSRPMRRWEYTLGKFLALFFFGGLALLSPIIIILMTATFASPEWSFLKDEWETIPQALIFVSVWIATLALIVLTVSSFTTRRMHALVASAGIVYGTQAISHMMARVIQDNRTTVADLFNNMERIGERVFEVTLVHDRGVSVEASGLAIALVWIVCLFVLTERIRKLEVVA